MSCRIRNWASWQTYRRDRGQPPWIKVHREVLRNPDWVALTDAQRGQLVSLWILAADKDGEIPNCGRVLMKLCYMDQEPDLELFERLGFIERDANVAPTWRQDAAPEAEAETEVEAEAEAEEDGGASRPASQKRRHVLPRDWRPKPAHEARAKAAGIDCTKEAWKFRAHAEANDRKVVRWDAAFTQWLMKAEEFAGERKKTGYRTQADRAEVRYKTANILEGW